MVEFTVEQIKEMSIYERVQNCRLFMQEEGIKKLGKNTFAKYDYYKLADLNTVMNKGLQKFRLCTHVQVTEQIAMLTIINVDKPSEEMLFTMPTVDAEMTKVTRIQNWGSTVSYLTRYLVLQAFQIGECEVDVDSTEQSEARANAEAKKPASIKEEVVALCREKSKDNRNAVSEIIKKHNNNSIAVSKIEDEEVLKQIKAEVEAL